jgi:hypothetical protein
MSPRWLVLLVAVAIVAAGCGGSSGSKFPTIGAARTYQLEGFEPSAPVQPGKPAKVSFTIRQPNGKPLTDFKRGSGPHTGVHLIIVRKDLSTIIHRHPPISADGKISDTITFTEPGPYRVVVDAYPNTTGPQRNFQLFGQLNVAGKYTPKKSPAFTPSVTVDGYTVSMKRNPNLHAIQAGFIPITVTGPDGKPAEFTPWYGALAHAIFFREGSLDYFHTHVCAPGASGCTSAIGGATVTGSSTTPGKLDVGVLVPVSGTWRLFLQTKTNGHVITAPFTINVKP